MTGLRISVFATRPGIIDAVIKGGNFTQGLAVGFENGAGAAPIASNVVVLDSSTIS